MHATPHPDPAPGPHPPVDPRSGIAAREPVDPHAASPFGIGTPRPMRTRLVRPGDSVEQDTLAPPSDSFPSSPSSVTSVPLETLGTLPPPPSPVTPATSDTPETLAPDSVAVPLALSTDVFPAGLNGALQRFPKVETQAVLLPRKAAFVPSWKPHWGRVQTIGLTFPAGLEFVPPKPEKPAPSADEVPSAEEQPTAADEPSAEPDPVAAAEGTANPAPETKPPKRTRVKPPADALSLEDRLFYVLQPPLESWLAGQELIMPFEPFPYQYEGIAWLFAHRSALLADEMGLGKTMQTITALRLLLRAGQARKILLTCPKPLIPNWQREFKTWAEELPVTTVEGDGPRRRMLWTLPGPVILLANYEVLVRDMETFAEDERPQYDLVVLDEAQRIKNRDSRTSETARALRRRRSWALTGTPIENRPEELASLFEFLGVIPERGTPDLKQLGRLAREHILRRTKDLVMTDLPPRLDRDEFLELSPAQKSAYEAAEKDGVIQLDGLGESITVQHVFELVLRLKQIANYDPLTGESAKLDRLAADMEEIAASGGKAILFSQWTRSLDWIRDRLAERVPQCGTLIYHGGVPTKQREPILAKFKQDPDSHLLLMSYGTGAVGLNLQFAGYVFLFDRWWNPAVEDQAINRAHRIGQKSQVIVTKFISKDTVEERIDKVLAQKRQLFAEILGEGEKTNASLSLNASEIFGLFDLKARAGKGVRKIGPPPPPQTDAA